MRAKWLVLYGLVQLLIVLNVSYCLRLDRSGWRRVEPPADGTTSQYYPTIVSDEVASRSKLENRSSRQPVDVNKNAIKKLVQWDDDDLATNNLNDLVDLPINKKVQQQQNQNSQNNRKQSDPLPEVATPQTGSSKFSSIKKSFSNKNFGKRPNRLIFHGQISGQTSAVRVVDGLKITIDTRQPVSISRRRQWSDFSPANNNNNNLLSGWTPENEPEESFSATNVSSRLGDGYRGNKAAELTDHLRSSSDWRPIAVSSLRSRRSKDLGANKTTSGDSSNKPFKMEADLKWKPISVSVSGASKQKGAKLSDKIEEPQEEKEESVRTRVNLFKLPRRKTNKRKEESVIYGKKTVDSPNVVAASQREIHSTINEPFDEDDGIITARRAASGPAKAAKGDEFDFVKRAAKSIGEKTDDEQQEDGDEVFRKKLESERWLPVDSTTTEQPLPTTTTALPGIRDSPAIGGNSSEAAHKSASDLNYIYSQPVVGGGGQSAPELFRQPSQTGSSSYYSNYLVQGQQPASQLVPEQPQPFIEQPIVDTTSGQLPEMVAERVPEAPVSVALPIPADSYSSYSMPQSSQAAFQPAQPPPSRDQNPQAAYGGYYQQQQPPPAQPVRQPPMVAAQPAGSSAYGYQNQQQQQVAATPAPAQVVRQEHHYHYYNQQQQQQAGRNFQQPERQFQQLSTQQPIQSVIREVQPVFISQPIIQQQQASTTTTTTTTTTPAPPQIIREIIKEVPVQSVQLQQMPTRMVLPAPAQTFAFVPAAMAKDQFDSTSFMQSYAASLAAPAQRVIRQISNSIPQVSVRMPASVAAVVPQIRLQSTLQQALQFPARLASSSQPAASGQSVTRQTASFVIPPMPKKTTTFLTETQAMPTHTTIMHTTQFTPATRTTVYTTDHQAPPQTIRSAIAAAAGGYKR